MPVLPPSIAELADTLARMPGAVAVTLGGSRSSGVADAGSDWDLGVYYSGNIDTAALAAHGTVHPPGAWGRLMNGGAWLEIDGQKVDVLLRDLQVVERWSSLAERGEYEVDALLGYVAGVPTYSLLAERALGRVLRGELPAVGAFPEPLAVSASVRWAYHAQFSVDHARMRAARGDVVGTVGQLAKAVIEKAHARLATDRRWVLNEKRIVEAAGLEHMHPLMASAPNSQAELVQWVTHVAAALAQTA